MKERSYFWDNYKGILIVLVVYGHFIYECATKLHNSFANDVFTFIYIFHMPAFVFCSGYLSKSNNACKPRAIVKLVLCYIFLNSFLALYYCLCKGSQMNLLTPYASAWYILSLCVWRISVKHIAKIKGILPVTVIVALLIGFWDEFDNVLSLSRTIAYYPFFLLGYRLNETKLEKVLSNKTPVKTVISIFVAVLCSIGLFLLIRKIPINPAVLFMEPYSSGRYIIYRSVILTVAAVAILVMIYMVPNVKLPFITKLGKNSLLIYLVHRFVTFIFNFIFPYKNYTKAYLVYAALATCLTVAIFGTDKINKWFHVFLDRISDEMIAKDSKAGKRIIAALLAITLVILAVPVARKSINNLKGSQFKQNTDVSSTIDNSIVVSFVGDLILLKDQVESAYDNETGEYSFDAVFAHAEKYLSQADLAIGVFEGPTAGEESGYTTSDFYDKVKLYVNFPDSFAHAIKRAGIDFVTTANNHLLDMGIEGAMRTLDVLEEAGLAHTGSYRNSEEKDKIAIVDVEGVKIAILAYTWSVNNYSNEEILNNYPYVTSMLPDVNDASFQQLMPEIENDFEQAKAANADVIVVMPHMGTQFSHETDEFQNYWNQKFSELGADVILGDHAHAVQPIEQIGDTIVINCPGNFANSYISYDGDATSIVEVYINKESKKAVATAVIPMYTQEMQSGYFRAVPIYDILTQNEICDQMAHIDLERINQVHKLITKVMLSEEITVDNVQPRYFYINGRYAQYTYSMLDDLSEYKDTKFYNLIESSSNIVYIGDSITNGSHNKGHPWFEPLMSQFENKKVQNISYPGATTQEIIRDFSEEIISSNGDLYIVAIGTNDIRYQDAQRCDLTPQAYVKRIGELTEVILESNRNARIVLISPWATLNNDRLSKLKHDEKIEMMQMYGTELKAFADEQSYYFIDPNQTILSFFETHQRFQYTSDGIHPNATKGTDLYSWAVIESSKISMG